MSKCENEKIVTYLLSWLCYGNTEAAARVAYTADEKALADHDVLIIPNGHLGRDIVLPDMNRVVVELPAKGKAIIRTDIVYNAFFFTSRAEELLHTERDCHGRFLARFSILGQNNCLQIPSLDEHARLLLKLLNMPLPESRFNHIYLTHDIDTISQYRSLRGALGGIKRGEWEQVRSSLKNIHNDPLYTFPWMVAQDKEVPDSETVYFVKHTQGKGFDYPQYCLWGHDYRHLHRMLRNSGAFLGVHSSYYGDLTPPLGEEEGGRCLHRSHYLRASIGQFEHLIQTGYTDDFTMGFADQAGFRLQTTRAVRWINPKTMELTPLTLHPLTVMDCTLSNGNYMNLTEDEAYFLCERLIDKVKMHHGDLCLLWHNSSLTPDTYHRSLYPKILDILTTND